MHAIAAQVSIYPLRTAHLGPPIERAQEVFRRAGLDVHEGPMSTVVTGDPHALFSALEEAFAAVSGDGAAVLVVTVSNACPVG